MKDRRPLEEIYYDILHNIHNMPLIQRKVSRIQQRSGLSFNRIKNYLTNLEKINLITFDPYALTPKGLQYIEDFASVLYKTAQLKKIYFATIPRISNSRNQVSLFPRPSKLSKYFPNINDAPPTMSEVIDMQQVINAQNAIIQELEA